LCTHLPKRYKRQIPVGGKRQKLGKAETGSQRDNPQNHTGQYIGANHEAESTATGLAELLPYGKHIRQAAGSRQLDKKPAAILHLASMEEARQEKKEPDAAGGRLVACVC